MIKIGNLVLNGICYRKADTELITYACSELQKYLMLITGEKLEIFDADARPADKAEHCFLPHFQGNPLKSPLFRHRKRQDRLF